MVADLRAESDALDTLVADLPEAGWPTPTPSPGWTIAHQIAHLLWTDRVALKSITDEAAFAALLGEAAKDPLGFVDAGRRGTGTHPAGRTAGLLAPRPGRAARWAARRGRRPQAALVRPADERAVDGHRPADGDLGARAGCRRRTRCPAAGHRPVALDRPYRRAHKGFRLHRARAHAARGGVSRGTDRSGRRIVDMGTRRRRPDA